MCVCVCVGDRDFFVDRISRGAGELLFWLLLGNGGGNAAVEVVSAVIELGRVTNAQCERSVPSDAGGAESARGRVRGARRHARAPGAASIPVDPGGRPVRARPRI